MWWFEYWNVNRWVCRSNNKLKSFKSRKLKDFDTRQSLKHKTHDFWCLKINSFHRSIKISYICSKFRFSIWLSHCMTRCCSKINFDCLISYFEINEASRARIMRSLNARSFVKDVKRFLTNSFELRVNRLIFEMFVFMFWIFLLWKFFTIEESIFSLLTFKSSIDYMFITKNSKKTIRIWFCDSIDES